MRDGDKFSLGVTRRTFMAGLGGVAAVSVIGRLGPGCCRQGSAGTGSFGKRRETAAVGGTSAKKSDGGDAA